MDQIIVKRRDLTWSQGNPFEGVTSGHISYAYECRQIGDPRKSKVYNDGACLADKVNAVLLRASGRVLGARQNRLDQFFHRLRLSRYAAGSPLINRLILVFMIRQKFGFLFPPSGHTQSVVRGNKLPRLLNLAVLFFPLRPGSPKSLRPESLRAVLRKQRFDLGFPVRHRPRESVGYCLLNSPPQGLPARRIGACAARVPAKSAARRGELGFGA